MAIQTPPKNDICFYRFLLFRWTWAWAFALFATAADLEGLRPLEHADYDRWNTISNQSISPDGQWVMFGIQNGAIDADPILKIRNIESAQEFTIDRGAQGLFSFDSRFAVYAIEPSIKNIKELQKQKAKPEDLPVANLEVLDLPTGDHVTINRVKSFQLAPENGRWLVYQLHPPVKEETVKQQQSDHNEVYEITTQGLRRPVQEVPLKKRESATETPAANTNPEPTTESKVKSNQAKANTESEPECKDKGDDESKEEIPIGTTLVLRDLENGNEYRFDSVHEYVISKHGHTMAFSTSLKQENDKDAKKEKDTDSQQDPDSDKKEEHTTDPPNNGVFVFDLTSLRLNQIASGLGQFQQLSLNDQGNRLAFLTNSNDVNSKTPRWELYLWRSGQKESQLIGTEGSAGIPNGWWVPETASLFFGEDNQRLYFGTVAIPEIVIEQRKDPCKTDADDEPKAKLDIWHWQDPVLQPQQLLEAEEERKRSYLAAYDLDANKIVQLATQDIPDIAIDRKSKSVLAVANTNRRHRKQLSWEIPGYQDTYLIHLKTGQHELVREKGRSPAIMSPEGKFIVWWNAEEKHWYSMATSGDRTPIKISKDIQVPLQDELHDRPMLPQPYGIAGWLKDDSGVLIYDRFDIWNLDLEGAKTAQCVTEKQGREEKIRFRYQQLDPEERAMDPRQPFILSAFSERTKASGYYRLQIQIEKDASSASASQLQKLIFLDESISGLSKARNTDRVIFHRSTFRKFPDIWSSTTDFKTVRRISKANSQQQEYIWGTPELIHWQGDDGTKHDGMLFKPDGFEPTKKYPLMVYFYERNSDRLHSYHVPAAGRSIINFSFYVSRGYVLFVPDIPYKTGQPGPSAVHSVVPGVKHLIGQGFVDEKRIGVQGHSWGGYQIAFMVTQTDIFACAEAGAPVSNMTSAYGGIRWGSGLSRMFQYERTQSRIGDHIWAARQKYIDNSPLFFADRIKTPLLILHNDEDGAVPWYQGIELFLAMRRLEKPVWMLNYNQEPHWVMKQENRRDFATRMQQFFDHYLMDAPEPEWMAIGVPAVDKGKKLGLELLEPNPE